MRFRQRAAKNGKILGEDKDRPAAHCSPTGDHAVAGNLILGHAEIRRPVLDEHSEFFERPLVEKTMDSLACRQLATIVLNRDPRLTAAKARLGPALFQLLEDLLHKYRPLPATTTLITTDGDSWEKKERLMTDAKDVRSGPGGATGGIRTLLRIEGLALLLVSMIGYGLK
jgi:hypothetical protein